LIDKNSCLSIAIFKYGIVIFALLCVLNELKLQALKIMLIDVTYKFINFILHFKMGPGVLGVTLVLVQPLAGMELK